MQKVFFPQVLLHIVFFLLLPVVLGLMLIGGLCICVLRAIGIHQKVFKDNVVLVDAVNWVFEKSRICPDWSYIPIAFLVICFFTVVVTLVVAVTSVILRYIRGRHIRIGKETKRIVGAKGEKPWD